MAKVTRSVLKELVKECLVEILFEGIDSESGYLEDESVIRESRKLNPRGSRPSSKPKRKSNPPKPALKEEAIEHMVGGLTQDPVMQSIFADTAQTTLMEQREGKGRAPHVPADKAAAVVKESNPEDLFEGAGNWAALAFNEVDKKA